MSVYMFQMENGIVYDGHNEIEIKDFVAEIKEEMTPAMKLLIESHGGIEVATYEFPVQNFSAANGYAHIQVVDGKMILSEPVDDQMRHLIESNGGKRVETSKKKIKRGAK